MHGSCYKILLALLHVLWAGVRCITISDHGPAEFTGTTCSFHVGVSVYIHWISVPIYYLTLLTILSRGLALRIILYEYKIEIQTEEVSVFHFALEV